MATILCEYVTVVFVSELPPPTFTELAIAPTTPPIPKAFVTPPRFTLAPPFVPWLIEVDGGCGIGFDGVFNAGATGIYNFLISEFGNGFGFYAGPGASIGLEEESLFTISAAGMAGLEYTLFELPIQFSLDFRQHIGIRVNGSGLWTPSSICLGVRYLFW